MHPPFVGARLSVAGHLGTIRYLGTVDGTVGKWIGVEWDDPQRGKHNGTHGDKQYFNCRIPNAGSFIRESQNISYGVSFLQALSAKYVEELFSAKKPEAVTLGSSNGAIQVEAVGLNKIRNKLARLERLREISLDGENVAFADPRGAIQTTCPNIRSLDLSSSLISDWDAIAAIAIELPVLAALALNHNRLLPPTQYDSFAKSFLNLEDLQLNDTLTSWNEMQGVTACMPKLNLVELGYNHLRLQSTEMASSLRRSRIQIINLEGNGLTSWTTICQFVTEYPSLKRLVLESNAIDSISQIDGSSLELPGLHHLSLRNNLLHKWQDVDALVNWCPGLQSLALSGNPLYTDHETKNYTRAFVIARIPSLVILDGVHISSKDRLDSELFYLSYVAKQGPETEALRKETHPRWYSLCEKHGAPEFTPQNAGHGSKLGDRLIELRLYQCSGSPDDLGPFLATVPKTLRVLPTMPLRALRARVAALMKASKPHCVSLWLVMASHNFVKLGQDQDSQDLSWMGIDQGSQIICAALES